MKSKKIKPVIARENFDCTEFTTMSHNYIKCNVDNPFRANSQATVRYEFSNQAHFKIKLTLNFNPFLYIVHFQT